MNAAVTTILTTGQRITYKRQHSTIEETVENAASALKVEPELIASSWWDSNTEDGIYEVTKQVQQIMRNKKCS